MSNNSDKKYTPVEAAVAVLNKVKEITLAKAKVDEGKQDNQKKLDRSVRKFPDAKIREQEIRGTSGAQAGVNKEVRVKGNTHTGESFAGKQARSPNPGYAIPEAKKVLSEAIKMRDKDRSGMGKSEENPDEKADAQLGEKVENAVHEHEATSEHPEQHEKGHLALAKFMGRMEHKRGQKSKEMDKGENQPHPGSSLSEHQKIYDSKMQSKQEDHLKSPEGDAQRKLENAKKMESKK